MKHVIKKVSIGLIILFVGILIGGAVTFFGSRIHTSLNVNQTFSAWCGTAWEAYYEEEPQVALRALEKVLDYFENDYIYFGSMNDNWPLNSDIVRSYTKAAILSDKLGYDDKYRKYIKAALSISEKHEQAIFKKLRTEKDLLEFQREWEEILEKKKNP